jgi:hypothetical protein
VEPDDGEVLLPVADVTLSTAAVLANPANSFAERALAVMLGWVQVIVLPLVKAVATCAEKITVRTPDVPEPLATSRSTA